MQAMRYRGSALLLAVFMIAAVMATPASAQVPLLDFHGFDWFWPAPIGQPGSCYGAVGYVPVVNPTFLNFDYLTYEYTFQWEYACFVSADTFGTIAIYQYDGTAVSPAFSVYCDSLGTGTTADYGDPTPPPNGVSPSTWVDGECVLGGDWAGNVTIVLDLTTMNGDISGTLDWTTGTQLGNIPVESRTMAIELAGITFAPPMGPAGYHWQVDGQIFIQPPVPTERTSWGAIKNQFGREQ